MKRSEQNEKKTGAYSRNRLYLCLSGYGQRLFGDLYLFIKGWRVCQCPNRQLCPVGMAIAHGDVKKVFTYLIPMCFYVIGIAMTVTMPRLLDENKLFAVGYSVRGAGDRPAVCGGLSAKIGALYRVHRNGGLYLRHAVQYV